NVGTLNSAKDSLLLQGSDFEGIGNGDQYLDSYESIQIVQTIVAEGCQDGTISSVINTHWGCGNTVITGTSTNAHISTSLKLPSLSLSSTQSLGTCFGQGIADLQTITLENKGSGTAFETILEIFKSTGSGYEENIFSKIDPNSITYQWETNGTPQAISPTQSWPTQSSGDYACLGTDPIGKVSLTLPDIPSGERLIIKFYTQSCCIDLCQNQRNSGWKYKVDYNDACRLNPQSSTKTGQSPLDGLMAVFSESPSDISDGQTEEFHFTVSSHTNELPLGPGARYVLSFDIPQGLSWSGQEEDLEWHSGPNQWEAEYVIYDSLARTLTAAYGLEAPFELPKSEILIYLTGDCSAGLSSQDIDLGLQVLFQPDTTCNGCQIPLLCNQTTTLRLHCPGACSEGLAFKRYQIERINFGQPDNDQNGLADNSGSLDQQKIKTNRVMVGDSLKGSFLGVVHTSANFPEWAFGYAQSSIEMGSNLSIYQATIKIFDASANSYLSCNDVAYSSSLDGTKQIFKYDFSPAFLSNCNLQGFSFAEGDSIWLDTYYRVDGNIGPKVQELLVENRFYVSDLVNPSAEKDKYECDIYDGKFTLIGYLFKNDWKNNYTVNKCNRWISQSFYLSIGDCCSNYAGGNLFPYEYRSWAYINEAKVAIPEHYEILDIRLKQTRTKFTNGTQTQTIKNIEADSSALDTLYFDLAQYYEDQGGNLAYSDDGFEGRLEIKIAPTCDVTPNSWQDVPWSFTFGKRPILGGGTTDWYHASNPDRVRFLPATLALSSPAPTIDGLSPTVAWTLKVKNSSGNTDSDNAWMHLKSPSEGVEILSVIDIDQGD
ncbi:MAG: hypothetical protein AAFQ68_24840, partial [Bacteroidota bacterium]